MQRLCSKGSNRSFLRQDQSLPAAIITKHMWTSKSVKHGGESYPIYVLLLANGFLSVVSECLEVCLTV
eukprot:4263693-Pleurochrysis_carterae.AAC.3